MVLRCPRRPRAAESAHSELAGCFGERRATVHAPWNPAMGTGWLKLGPSCCISTWGLTNPRPCHHANGRPERFHGGVGAEAWSHGRPGYRAECRDADALRCAGHGQLRDAAGGIPRQDYDGRDGVQDPLAAADVSGWRSARHDFRTTRVWDGTAVYITGPAYWIAWVDTCAQEEAAATAENRTILEDAANTGAGVPDTLPEGAIALFVDRRACASTMRSC